MPPFEVFLLAYDNPPAGDPPAGDPPAGDPPADKVFTQEELNKIIANERKAHEDKTKAVMSELETLKKSKGLSEQDRAALNAKIEELGNTLLSKEQLAAKEKEKLERAAKETAEKLTAERDLWLGRYREERIVRSILDGSTAAGAISGQQIIALLKPSTRLVEDQDGDGNPTGNFTPKVTYQDTDKEGKPVTLDLTVAEAIQRMVDTPDTYGNLFQSTLKGGMGRGENVPGKAKDIKKVTPEEYQALRKKNGPGAGFAE